MCVIFDYCDLVSHPEIIFILAGITVWKSGKPICKQNRISRNGEYGIHVKDGGWGTFEENDVRSNGRGGLLITADSQLKVVQERNLID